MSPAENEAILFRAQRLIDNLRNCNSGCDVHAVGNMKNVAEFIKTAVHDFDRLKISHETLHAMILRLEDTQVNFFKKKFQHLGKKI